MKEIFLKILLCAYAVVLIIILSSSISFGQDTKTPFATTPSPLVNRYAYSNNGLWIDSAVKLVYYKQTSDSTLLGVDMNGKLYKVTKSMIGRWMSGGGGTGSVTSVGLAMPSAFSVTGGPVTGAGTLTVTGNGTSGQYITGTGALATFPTTPTVYSSNGTLTSDRTVNGGGNNLSFYGLNDFNVGTGGGYFHLTDNGDFSLTTIRPSAGLLGLMTITNDGNYSFNSYDNGSSSLERLQITGGDDTANLTVSNAHLQFNPGVVNNNSSSAYKMLVEDTVTGYLERVDRSALGTVTNVSGTTPIHVVNGTTTPAISIDNSGADGVTKGAASFTASDFNSAAGVISIDYANAQAASTTQKGFLSSTDWNTFNSKQGVLTLTTTGTSGAATLVGNALNIPNYSSGGGATANPTESIGLTTVNGSATTYMRSDAAPALSQSITPTWTAKHTFTTPVTTGTGATSGLQIISNSLTTGNGLEISSSSVSSGSLVNIFTTSTAATNNMQTGLNVSLSGVNSSNSQRTYASQFSNIHGGVGAVNTAVFASASGGSNNNAALFYDGNVGVGNNFTPIYKLQVTSSGGQNEGIGIVSTNSGAASYSGLTLVNSTNEIGQLFFTSAGYSIVSSIGAKAIGFYTNGPGGMALVSDGVGSIRFVTGGLTQKCEISSTGYFGAGVSGANSQIQTTSFAVGYIAKTANYTLTASDHIVNCISNSFTITLPTAVGITGREYIIKNTGSSTTISIATTSSQTIDGAAPGSVTSLAPLRVVSDGANWITW